MHFVAPLVPGRLIARYKRFLADVRLADGDLATVHCPNPGAMLGLATPGNTVWLSPALSLTRKLPYGWELVEADLGRGAELVGINTAVPNRLVAEALRGGFFPEFAAYRHVRPEVRYGRASRVDFLLTDGPQGTLPPCYVEVKNVHLMRTPGLAEFPDCVTLRGARHLEDLSAMVAGGARAAMLYVIQMDADRFDLARDLDPGYARAFDAARHAGVEMLAVACRITPLGIGMARRVPVVA